MPAPEFLEFLEVIGRELNDARTWWLPDVPWAEAQALVVILLAKHGVCDRHAALLAAMVVTAWRRRALEVLGAIPGMVSIHTRDLSEGPWDQVDDLVAVDSVARILRAMLYGTPVGGVLEVDRERLRVRVVCVIAEGQGVTRTRISLRRLRAWRNGTGDAAAAIRAKG